LCIETFGERLDEVALRTGDDGVFRVRVGDELVSDKHEHGPYDPDEVVRAARARL
jgi:selenoprotein W-related protein